MATTTDAVVPSDLQQLTAELTAIERDAEGLVAPLDDEQFNWQPRPGAWSIAQCFDHLNESNTLYFAAIRGAVKRARAAGLVRTGPIRSSWFGRRFIASLEPPVGLRLRSPRYVRPADRKLKAEVWPEFVRIHTQMRAFVADVADVDLNRARFPNPFATGVTMRAGTALRIIAAHDRRHLWQARRVRETAGFPRS